MHRYFIRSCAGMMLFSVLFLFGCAIKVGSPFDTTHVSKIQAGSTTKAQVQELLGSPTSEGLKDGKPLWTYLFAQVSMFGGRAKGTVLTVEFDEKGIVQSYSYVPY